MDDQHQSYAPYGRTLTYDEYRAAERTFQEADSLLPPPIGPFHPCIPTPWRGLNAKLGREKEGIKPGALVSMSSGNHKFASRILRRLRAYVDKLGYPTPFTECRRDQTYAQVAADVVASANSGCPVIIVDWFPNLALEEQGDDPPSHEDQAMNFFNDIRAAAHRNRVLVLLGACMSPEALAVGATEEACEYPIRGRRMVEERCDYSVICWPDKTDQTQTRGKLVTVPESPHRLEHPIPFAFETPA